ncbi:hypothetical protein [Desulfosporosinus youngiae]|uniref:Uncharacterized protein n=1 Tax=Desulfosporosinus youngiae DSM 17734 TaxID=768710 RepID=H5Y489_9FIRM|nr:hypothetical protein [Desulfosporosinus youngiae]EHQ89917.1 hypothetical protein DesyoDRAFT_2869 [Desulfosporosinus youngiae DSM 17734]
MNGLLSSILGYLRFFLILLGLTYFLDELWNWFEGDSLLRNAIAMTIAIMLFDLGRLLFKKLNLKKDASV